MARHPSPTPIRPARDDDSRGITRLITGVWSEYPGVLFVEEENRDLEKVATHYAMAGGQFWVIETGRDIVGSVGLTPAADDRGMELHRLYVARSARRHGLGTRLCAQVEESSRNREAKFVDLWSDTRFTDAHRLYERMGYARGPRTRELHDLSGTIEHYFRKIL